MLHRHRKRFAPVLRKVVHEWPSNFLSCHPPRNSGNLQVRNSDHESSFATASRQLGSRRVEESLNRGPAVFGIPDRRLCLQSWGDEHLSSFALRVRTRGRLNRSFPQFALSFCVVASDAIPSWSIQTSRKRENHRSRSSALLQLIDELQHELAHILKTVANATNRVESRTSPLGHPPEAGGPASPPARAGAEMG